MSYLEAQKHGDATKLSAPPAACILWASGPSMSAVRLGVVGLEAHSREQRQAEKFVSYHVFALQEKRFVGLKTYFREQHAFLWASVPA